MWIQYLFRLRQIILIIIVTLFSSVLYGQNNLSSSVSLYFHQGGDVILDNEYLSELDSLITDMQRDTLVAISHIDVVSYSSPEGSLRRNVELTYLRGDAVKEYLTNRLSIPDSLITTTSGGVGWGKLDSLVVSENLPYAHEVRAIISANSPLSREKLLVDMDGGVPYRELFRYIYPQLRSSEVTIYSTRREVVAPKVEVVIPIVDTEQVTPIESRAAEITTEVKPLIAIKTNLLFDILTLINVEVEIPIRERWSVAGEFIFPWWVMDNHKEDSRRNRLQLLNGNLEGRYWWGDRESRPILTGWFTGLYTGVGSYDIEYDATGYQGEFFIAAGLSGGYAHMINKARNLRLEYSVGVGYLATDYRRYEAEYCHNGVWHAVKQSSGHYSWFGPTRAKISLSWLINYNLKKR